MRNPARAGKPGGCLDGDVRAGASTMKRAGAQTLRLGDFNRARLRRSLRVHALSIRDRATASSAHRWRLNMIATLGGRGGHRLHSAGCAT